MQETLVWSMIWEDPTWLHGATKPVPDNHWACDVEPENLNYESPHAPGPMLCNERGRESLSLSRVWLFATPWAVAHQDTLFMEFSRQEYWSGGHFFLRLSSWPRDWTWVSHTAGRFFTVWAARADPVTREATTMRGPWTTTRESLLLPMWQWRPSMAKNKS